MKKSQLASLIREEFLALAEATYKVPADKVDDIKGKLEDEDTVEVTEDVDDIEDDEKAHKAATKGGKKPTKKDKKEGDIIKNYKEIESKVKDSIKKSKGGDKEALNYLLSKQPIIKAYNDLKKSKNIF